MKDMKGNALMAYEDDIRNRNVLDWIRAHTSFALPLHRFHGELILTEEMLLFNGTDKQTKDDHSTQIHKSEVEDVYHGLDDVFRRRDDRSAGIGFQPLRITFVKNDKKRIIYFIMDFKRASRRTTNGEWYRKITDWYES